MKRVAVAIACMLGLSGCLITPEQELYYRDNTTEQEFEQDKMACASEALAATAQVRANNPFMANMLSVDIVKTCLLGKGYVKQDIEE